MNVKSKIYSIINLIRGRKNDFHVAYEFGSPLPAPVEIKHKTIFEYAQANKIDILVETGTFLGATISAALPFFQRIYSIEVKKELANNAKAKFKDNEKVTIIEGDSEQELGELIKSLDKPVVFWLDGHYSGGITGKIGRAHV